MNDDTMEVDSEQETAEQREQRALKLKAEGNKKYSSKKYQDAINLYTQAITTFPRPEFYGNRAASFIAIYKFKQGLSDCLSAIQLDPNYRKAYVRGVKCYTELADLKSAQQFAKDGLDKFPHDNDLQQGYDRVEIIRNKLRRIDEKLRTVSCKYNSFFESQLNPESNTNVNDKNESDLKDFEEEKSIEKEEKVVHKLSIVDDKEIEIAISMINSLLSNDLSQSIELKCTHIRALIIKQNYDVALSKSTNLLRWHKGDNKVTELRAIALFRCGNTDSAIKHLQQILRKDPDNRATKSLFKLFKQIGRRKEAANKAFKSNSLEAALTAYTSCLSLDPTNLKFNCIIYANRAAVWLKKKSWQNAYNDATSAIDLDNLYIKAYGRRLQALYGLDRYDEAVGDAEKALNLDPSSSDLKQQLREAKIELKKSKRKNYYKILGVEKDATEKEIKKGFRKKAMQWHPDKFASSESEEEKKRAEEKFKEIGEAYEVLKDPKMKQRYDSGVDIDHLKSGGFGGFGGGGVDISHIFDLLGGMGGHGGHGGHGGGHPGFQHFSSGGGNGQNFTFRFG